MSIITLAANGPQITFSRPAWLNGKFRAQVIIGSNRYSEDGDTEKLAADNLRNKLKELWKYSEQHKHMFM